jgi:hypothetical protein
MSSTIDSTLNTQKWSVCYFRHLSSFSCWCGLYSSWFGIFLYVFLNKLGRLDFYNFQIFIFIIFKKIVLWIHLYTFLHVVFTLTIFWVNSVINFDVLAYITFRGVHTIDIATHIFMLMANGFVIVGAIGLQLT